MFHIHRFTETERVYSGKSGMTTVQGDRKYIERMTFGVTTILSKCCICGKLQTVEVLGDAWKSSNRLD